MHGPEGDEKVAQMLRLRANLKKVRHKIVVLSGKGGVGKSTISLNLAVALVQKGYRVGLLDTDIHGPNLAHMVGHDASLMTIRENEIEPLEVRPNLFLVSLALTGKPVDTAYIWRGPIKIALINQLMADSLWPDLDYLVIDSPPGTGDEPLTVCQLLNSSPSRGALIVTTPQSVSVLDARRTIDFSRQLKMPLLGVVENMAGYLAPDGRLLPLFGENGGRTAAEELQVPFLGSIPMDPAATAASEAGRALLEQPSPLQGAFDEVVRRVVEAFEKP